MINRKGQVFLMATIIIVGIMLSLVRISNKSVAREEPEAFFDLADEIGFETKRVLDYGVINPPITGTTVGDFAGQLLNNYSELISNEDVAFVYGDISEVKAYYYKSVGVNAITILSGVVSSITLINRHTINAERNGNDVKVNVRGNDYTFNLKPGQNFYFVLIKDEEDEQFVTVK